MSVTSVIQDEVAKGNNFIINVFDAIKDEVNNVMEPILSVSLVIAGIGAIVYLAQVLLPMIERNEGIDFYPLLKPIFVALMVTNFGAFVGVLDSTLEAISNSIGSGYETNQILDIDFSQAKERNEKRLEAELLKLDSEKRGPKEDQGFWEGVWEGTKETLADLFYSITGVHPSQIGDQIGLFLKYDVLFPFFAWLATMLGTLAYVIINMMSRFYLIFLALFGPISFALSQFSYFQSSFGAWLARYISVGLWPAIANLLKYMCNEVIFQMGGLVGESFEGGITLFLLLIILSYFYLQIPEISEYIVTSGGAGGLNGSMTKSIKRSATVTAIAAAPAAGLYAGGLASASDGVVAGKVATKVHGLLSVQGQRTGAAGAFNRGGQYIGRWLGKGGLFLNDQMIAKSKGETTAETAARISQRITERQDRRSIAEAPPRKEMRKKAKSLRRHRRMGHLLSSEQEELLDRYKEGAYKGRGKYIPSPEQRQADRLRETKSFVLKGLQYGSTHTAFKSSVGDWRPPMKFPKE